MAISTGFKKVAQSGKTIDGREIKPEWLMDAAATYSKATYTASVFPDHNEAYGSYGTVEAVKAVQDKDGTVSLYADISPNALWQSDMRYGQNLFTSIAVMPNFAGTGKWYLYSLAATNNPASLGVEKLEFSKKEPTALFSAAFDTRETEPGQDAATSFFKSFFNFTKSQEQDMTKEQEALNAKVASLEDKFNEFSAQLPAATGQEARLTQLTAENVQLKAEIDAVVAKNKQYEAAHAELSTQFADLKQAFTEAVKEQPGTTPTRNFGAGGPPEDLTIYA
jgi:hypothetical protein